MLRIIYTVLFCLFAIPAFSQSLIKEVEKKFENGKPEIINYYAKVKAPENLAKKEYYSNDGTKVREENYKAGKLEGKVINWKPFDGTKESEYNFVAGAMDGDQLLFYSTGTPKATLKYTAGKMNGLQQSWHLNGTQLKSELNYSNGLLHGMQREWNQDGTPVYNLNFVAGKLNGIQRWWDQNAKLTEENWLQGALEQVKETWSTGRTKVAEKVECKVAGDSMHIAIEKVPVKEVAYYETASIRSIRDLNPPYGWKEFHPSGSVKCEGTGSEAKPEGTWTWYHPNGKKLRITEYVNGLPNGKVSEWDAEGRGTSEKVYSPDGSGKATVTSWSYTTWHPGTQKESEGSLDDKGRKTGNWKYWFPDGKLMREETWTNQCPGERPVLTSYKEWDSAGKLMSEGNEKSFTAWQYQPGGEKAFETKWEYPTRKPCNSSSLLYECNGKFISNLVVTAEGSHPELVDESKKQMTEKTTFFAGDKPQKKEIFDTEGKVHGKAEIWFESGQKQLEITYNHGKVEGSVKEWYASGKPMLDLMYEVFPGTNAVSLARGTFSYEEGKSYNYVREDDRELSKKMVEIEALSAWKTIRGF